MTGYTILVAYFIYVFFLIGYFSYFGFVPEVYALGLASAGDLTGVLDHYFQQVFGFEEVALLVSFLVLLILLPKQKLQKKASFLLVLPLALLGVNVGQFGDPVSNQNFGNGTIIRRFGLPTFYYLSALEWRNLSSDYVAKETPFPGKLAQIIYPDANTSDQKEVDVSTEIKRVVLVQVESFDREVVDAELNGVAAMPFVSNLKSSSCREYGNFYTTKSLGGSSDAEFSVATGRLPSSKRQSIRHTDFSEIETLYDILSGKGVDSYFAHNNFIGFYGRNLAYSQFEKLDYKFLQPDETTSERQFALDTFNNALNTSDRLFYYFFNFQSHGPYKRYSDQTKEKFSLLNETNIDSDYIATMHDVDQTIAEMFSLQQTSFDAGESLFILTADHPSYLSTDDTELSRARIPMLVCHNSFSGQQVDTVASTVDLFPTILDAFNISGEDMVIGNSLLKNMPNVVLFPTGTVLYQQEDGALQTKVCGDICQGYFDYTDQSIRVLR
ncbi:LTA synthase family protein [Rhodobacteraceae bacterium]|nr:LTA synthase family protein [Paracoccaceae bacterium]